MKCPNCGDINTYVRKHKHHMKVKGKDIFFTSKRRFCSACNHLIYDDLLDNIASTKVLDIYNEKYGIPKEKIMELRKNYNLSQEVFAKIIGCAKKTLISYEKGTSIPNDNFYITLKSLINNPNLISNLIDANKDTLSAKELKSINNRITPFLSNNIDGFLGKSKELTEFNGYTELNYEKIKNIIIFFSKSGILKTKLLKEMFYTDFLSYKLTGESITGLEYVKLSFGPVPDDFETIINILCAKNVINYKIEFAGTGDYEYHKITSNSKIDETIFNETELKILKKIKTFFKDYKSENIVNKSHEEKAFTATLFNQKIDYVYALYLNLDI